MNIPSRFGDFIGNGRVIETLHRAVAQDRLPHALIFSGPEGVGKTTLAVLLAARLNCESQTAEPPCGVCGSCVKIGAVLQARHIRCFTPRGEENCGGCPNCRILSNQHPDVRIIEPERSVITIDQVRSMIAEISYQPFQGRFRIVILDPADRMRPEAHNSLLKTLEEPPSQTFVVLVTSSPYLLLSTIRSRSRILQFGGIPRARIEEYLMRKAGRAPEDAHLAAIFSRGSLAAALDFDAGYYREIRSQALSFASLLLSRGSFTDATAQISGIVKGRDKELFPVWLGCLESLLHDVYFVHVAPERMSQKDVAEKLSALARDCPREQVVRVISKVRRIRIDLQRNINRQIAVESMFLAMAGDG